MSGLRFELQESEVAPDTYQALAEAVRNRIRRQVRRDRRVLKLKDDQFAWFSADVAPDDAFMPIERIRQTLTQTRFHHQGEPLEISIVASVVAGLPDDTPAELLQRLRGALQYALEHGEHSTCFDDGDGPREIAPQPVEVQDSECEV